MKYLIILALVAFAWCPWFGREEAARLVDARVAEVRTLYSDLCPLYVDQSSIRKVPFGFTEKVSYDCTQNDPVYGVTKSTNIVFVPFFKKVIGVPVKRLPHSE